MQGEYTVYGISNKNIPTVYSTILEEKFTILQSKSN